MASLPVMRGRSLKRGAGHQKAYRESQFLSGDQNFASSAKPGDYERLFPPVLFCRSVGRFAAVTKSQARVLGFVKVFLGHLVLRQVLRGPCAGDTPAVSVSFRFIEPKAVPQVMFCRVVLSYSRVSLAAELAAKKAIDSCQIRSAD